MFLLFKKGYDPLAFEKELTQITGSITSTQEQIYRLRRRRRSVRKTCIHYLLVVYVVGNLYNYTQIPPVSGTRTRFQGVVKGLSRNQWTFVVVFPVLLYFLVRMVSGLYDWLVSSRQTKLRGLQQKHKLKIEELKKITNFNTTSELLDKYGDPIERKKKKPTGEGTSSGAQSVPGNGQIKQRLHVNPGTINIPQQLPTEQSQRQQRQQGQPLQTQQIPEKANQPPINLVQTQNQPLPRSFQDRLLDMLVGSDSSEAVESRYALICANCYKHNGLAPPGCKEPHKVPYICPNCGLFNGEFQLSPSGVDANLLSAEFQPSRGPSPVPSQAADASITSDAENAHAISDDVNASVAETTEAAVEHPIQIGTDIESHST